jgi:hypothetical protein
MRAPVTTLDIAREAMPDSSSRPTSRKIIELSAMTSTSLLLRLELRDVAVEPV